MSGINDVQNWQHPQLDRRDIVQAGVVSALGLGMAGLGTLRSLSAEESGGA